MELLKKILKEITPDHEEVINKVNDVLKAINDEIKKQKKEAVCVKGGSIAKKTFLKDDHDCDLFVKFNLTLKDQDLSAILEEILKPIFPDIERIHGSRDYFRMHAKDIEYEIVPVLNIEEPSEMMNVTDASPLHVDWVCQREMSDEIRLAKAFCKANGVYGAESYIQGFSGHVIDILVSYYKGFIKFLEATQLWEEGYVIDFYDIYKGNALKELNEAKVVSPIIVIDPIMPERNAAAALGKEKFNLLIKAAKEFLDKPSEEFFRKKALTLEEIKQKAGDNKLIILKATPIEGKEDVMGAKLLKCFQHIKKQIIINEFRLFESGWTWKKGDDAVFYYVTNKDLLPETLLRQGPPLTARTHVDIFKEKNKETFEENGRIWANVKREFRDADDLIDSLIKTEFIKEKIERIEKLQ